MPSVPPRKQWPRGRLNGLHDAADIGSIERTVSILSSGSIDIDHTDPNGWTPLIFASVKGNKGVVRALLDKGANVSIAGDDGLTALLASVQYGHLAVTKMLIDEVRRLGGGDLEAAVTSDGFTPLHMAADTGDWEAVRALTEAGANPDSRALKGTTPLHVAASTGHVKAVSELLRAKANPLTSTVLPWGDACIPLDAAVTFGHLEVVRMLIQHHGIKGCGGASAGVYALRMATHNKQVQVVAILMDAGVIDTGVALATAATNGTEASVKLLLQKHKGGHSDKGAYVNSRHFFDKQTPLECCVEAYLPCSPRIARFLVDAGADAGADTTSAFRARHYAGRKTLCYTLLDFTTSGLREKTIRGENVTEEQLHSLRGIHRLLLQVEAVHAVSWLWPSDTPSTMHAMEGTAKVPVVSRPLALMFPTLRRRTESRRLVLLRTLFR